MVDLFTQFNSEKENTDNHKKVDMERVYSPSKKSVNEILAFANSYNYLELDDCDFKDFFSN